MATQRITRSADRATAEASNSANGTDYTDLTLENPNSRPIPTSKRAREEELERLALEEQRLRVFKLCKEIALIKEPSPADNGDDDEGEMPQIVQDIAPGYPQTKQAVLLQIYEDKFDPFDLYKLHTEFGSSVSVDSIDDEFFISKGKLGTKKRLGSAKDLGSVKRWSNAFLQYISIIATFRKHDISVLPALLDFHARIVKLDDSY